MTLWATLRETYSKIERDEKNLDPKNLNKFLLKDGMLINNAQLEVTLNAQGGVVDVSPIPKTEQQTLAPATPQSIIRTNTIAPHALFDKLDYLAKDWSIIQIENLDKKVQDKLIENQQRYKEYVELLGKWADYTKFEQIKIIYNFLKERNLLKEILSRISLQDFVKQDKDEDAGNSKGESITLEEEQVANTEDSAVVDLQDINEKVNLQVEREILTETANENIFNLENYTDVEMQEKIFEQNLQNIKKFIKNLDSIFVRFKVVCEGVEPNVYQNMDIINEWSQNYLEILGIESTMCLDYITGQEMPGALFYPKKIRNEGDGAKLISANDDTICTFGGRFNPKQPNQVVGIGHDSALQSLYALKWLIKNNNAFTYDGMVILAWNTELILDPNPICFNDEINIENGKYTFNINSDNAIITLASYGNYSKELEDFAKNPNDEKDNNTQNIDMTETNQQEKTSDLGKNRSINLLVLDNASSGRISVCYYNQIDSYLYYQRLINWFKTLRWKFWSKEKNSLEIRTPNFRKLFELIYKESKEDKKIFKHFYKTILPCVVEGKPFPKVFAKKVFAKVCQPQSFKDMNGGYSRGMWLEAINVACAIFNKCYNKEKYMELDVNETDRSYLFGRLLAIAERVENLAGEETVVTNAERLFTYYTMRPAQTFFTLQKQLEPYFEKLIKNGKAGLAYYFKNQMAEILDKMSKEDFKSNKALDEMFILGYYGQRNYRKDKETEEILTEENEIQGEE